MPLCLTIIDLKKAFDSVEMGAVVEALNNQGVPTQTGISLFYKNIIIDVKRGSDRVTQSHPKYSHPRERNEKAGMGRHGSEAESTKDDVHAERIGLGCPIHAQRNEHIRMHQLRLSGSGIEHDERSDPELGRRRRAAWEAYKSIEDVMKKTKNTPLCARLFTLRYFLL
ncbi:hypothetical protein RB195_017506 [Necator americanus]